jgi:hypothetical protein
LCATSSTGRDGLSLDRPPLPPPWSVEETDACFIVRDADGRALAMARETEEEWNNARPRRSLIDMDQKALVLRSPAAR